LPRCDGRVRSLEKTGEPELPCAVGGSAPLGRTATPSWPNSAPPPTAQGRKRGRLDSRSNLPEQSKINQKQLSQRVTPLLAHRITLTGNSYFWHAAAHRGNSLRNCGVGAETAGMTVHGGHRHGAKTAATGGGVTTWRGECGGRWAGGARRSQPPLQVARRTTLLPSAGKSRTMSRCTATGVWAGLGLDLRRG